MRRLIRFDAPEAFRFLSRTGACTCAEGGVFQGIFFFESMGVASYCRHRTRADITASGSAVGMSPVGRSVEGGQIYLGLYMMFPSACCNVLMLVNQNRHRRTGHAVNSATPMHPTRVVIVDNQTVARLGTHQLLEQAPTIQVVGEARSGQEALHLAHTLQVDVLVTEMRLPDLTGAEIAERLSQEGGDVAVLILSAYEDEAYVRQILSSPIAGYLLKSDTTAHVTEAVLGAAREETGWLSPSVARCLMNMRNQESELDACRLTEREREALEALTRGLSNEQIADALNLAPGTVKNHLTNIYEKLGVASRAEAIVWAHSVRFV